MYSTTQVDQSRWRDGGLKISYLWLVLLALPIIAVMAFAIFQPIQVLPRISLAPGFAFTDHDGNRLTNEDLRGKFVFYTFTHTNCSGDCPDPALAMREMQELVAGLDTGGLPIEFVTISFDPTHDTPERLRAYAEELDADLSNWHFVTGDSTRLKNVIGGGFSTYYEEMEDGTFKFDPAFVLVDGWGIIRAKYKTASPDPDIIERDIGLLASELNNSEGVNRFAYEAAHLFLCYPS
jgi:protein SCO1/2